MNRDAEKSGVDGGNPQPQAAQIGVEQVQVEAGDALAKAKFNTRRRLLVGGVLATPAILTLTSRPALANHCSISGMISGNLSKPHDVTCRGLPPSYWRANPQNWPTYTPGPCNPLAPQTSTTVCMDFSVPSDSELADAVAKNLLTEQQVIIYRSLPRGTLVSDVFGPGIAEPGLTLMQALWLGNGGPAPVLAQAVAAILNAHHFTVDNFGHSPEEIVRIVQDGISGNIATLLQNLEMLNGRG